MEGTDVCRTQFLVPCANGGELSENLDIFPHSLVLYDIINFIPKYILKKSSSIVKPIIPSKIDLYQRVSKGINQ